MLMEITNLTIKEKLKLWQERKKNAAVEKTGKASSIPGAESKSTTSDPKLARKRNRKYINSAISGAQALPKQSQSVKCFETQKRTKKENDDPNFNNEKDIDRNSTERSCESPGGVSVIAGSMQDMCIDTIHSEENDQSTRNLSMDKSEVERLQAQNAELLKQLAVANYERKEAFKLAKRSVSEIETLKFENEVMIQTVEGLEDQVTQCRMESFEKEGNSDKIKKQNATIRFLRQKNEEYEARANTMVAEMTEQMAALQDMAMKRIQQLENDLMLEQHKSQSQEDTLHKLEHCQKELAELKSNRRNTRRKTRRQSTFINMDDMVYGSDSTQEANDEDEESYGDDENDFDLVLGGNDDTDDDGDQDVS